MGWGRGRIIISPALLSSAKPGTGSTSKGKAVQDLHRTLSCLALVEVLGTSLHNDVQIRRFIIPMKE